MFEAELTDVIPVIYASIADCRIIGKINLSFSNHLFVFSKKQVGIKFMRNVLGTLFKAE